MRSADPIEARIRRAGEQDPNPPAGGVDERDDREKENETEDEGAGEPEEGTLGGEPQHTRSVSEGVICCQSSVVRSGTDN